MFATGETVDLAEWIIDDTCTEFHLLPFCRKLWEKELQSSTELPMSFTVFPVYTWSDLSLHFSGYVANDYKWSVSLEKKQIWRI